MKQSEKSRILIIAGPNGVGKTTFAEEFLPNEADCPIFVNADLIAAGLVPFDPDRAAIKAGRLCLQKFMTMFAGVRVLLLKRPSAAGFTPGIFPCGARMASR